MKWKRSDSSDSDSVELMTPLTTPIFDFHLVDHKLLCNSDSVDVENQPFQSVILGINVACKCHTLFIELV